MPAIRTIDEFEAEYRKGLGEPLPLHPWRTVSEESIRRFGDGVGDYNPLFREPRYARDGRFGDLVAGPAFIFSVNLGVMASLYGHLAPADVSTRDLTLLYLGADVTWHRPLWLGDRVRAVERPVAVERKQLRQIANGLVCTGRTDYWNSRGELVATLHNTMLRFENTGNPVRSAGRNDSSGTEAPDPLVWQRVRRGAEPLYWEDVQVGEAIPDLPKGTYTTTELYVFTHGVYDTARVPAVEEGIVDMGAAGRADATYAREHRAQEASFDWGPQRVCWLTQAVTDWMGDHGTLVRLDSRIRRPNLVGDTNVLRGSVLGRSVVDGRHLVTVRVEVRNQGDALTAEGTATVELPTRGSVTVPDWRGEALAAASGVYR